MSSARSMDLSSIGRSRAQLNSPGQTVACTCAGCPAGRRRQTWPAVARHMPGRWWAVVAVTTVKPYPDSAVAKKWRLI